MDLLCSVAYGLLLENAGNISTIQLFTIKYLFVDIAQKCWKNFCNRVFIIKYLFVVMALGPIIKMKRLLQNL